MKRFWLILVCTAVVPLTFVGCLTRPTKEAVINGRPLSTWLVGLDDTASKDQRQHAEAVIQGMGTNAIPALCQMLRRHDFWRREKVGEAAWQIQIRALKGLALLGNSASSATPVVLNVITRNCSSFSESEAVKPCAIQTLAKITTDLFSVLPQLLPQWKEVDPHARHWPTGYHYGRDIRLLSLQKGGFTNNWRILNLVHESVSGVVSDLQKIDRQRTVAALVSALEDTNAEVRYQACEWLEILCHENRPPVVESGVVRLLQDPNPFMRSMALDTLLIWSDERPGKDRWSSTRSELIPKLIAQLQDKDDIVRGQALIGVGHWASVQSQKDPELQSAVKQLLQDPNASVRFTATNIWRQMQGDDKWDSREPYFALGLDQAPLMGVIQMYATVRHKTVLTPAASNLPLDASVSVVGFGLLHEEEAAAILESELRRQAHVVMVQKPDGYLVAQRETQ